MSNQQSYAHCLFAHSSSVQFVRIGATADRSEYLLRLFGLVQTAKNLYKAPASMTHTGASSASSDHRDFVTTHWSVVLAAAQEDRPQSREAWETLAQNYWPPLYAYIRRSGREPEDAKDLTQSFFIGLMDRGALAGLEPGEEKFRSFLLVCLNHFLTDQHRHAQAARRRPESGWLRLDEAIAEGRYQTELVDPATPEILFERQWAATLMDQALARLEAYYSDQGRRDLFESLVAHLVRDPQAVPHLELAARLGTSEAAVKSDMYRFRQRFRLFFRREVAATVPPDEVEEEMRHVVRVLTR